MATLTALLTALGEALTVLKLALELRPPTESRHTTYGYAPASVGA